jgi:hypothetical protein
VWSKNQAANDRGTQGGSVTKTFCDRCGHYIGPGTGFVADFGIDAKIERKDLCAGCYKHYADFRHSVDALVRGEKKEFKDKFEALAMTFWKQHESEEVKAHGEATNAIWRQEG